jgi:hypothetical protein
MPGTNHREEGSVDAISARGEDADLTALFASVDQELAGVLEVIAFDRLAQDALGRNWRAVRGNHKRQLSLRHRDDGHF